MVKRIKRLKSAVESYKAEIEKHFEKLDKEILEKDEMLAKYHIKEIDKSLIVALEHKIGLIGAGVGDVELIRGYKNRLQEYKKKLGVN